MPEIPILCDPSHISGTQQYVASVAQAALEVGLDGLMIESHWRPEAALSDPGQQLSPTQLAKLMEQIACHIHSGVTSGNREIANLWREIDEIDQDLSALLSRRVSILRQIGDIQNRRERNLTQNLGEYLRDSPDGGSRKAIALERGKQTWPMRFRLPLYGNSLR